MKQLTEAIKEIARENPAGFTVDLTTLKKVTGGISVAYLETQNSFGDEGLKRVIKHALEHEKTVGGWMNNENYYFDSIRIFGDLEEALQFGRENEQLYIFDLGKQELIKL